MVSSNDFSPGKLVKIHGATGKLRGVAIRNAPDIEEFRYHLEAGHCYNCLLDGQTGQCLDGWDEESCIVRTVGGHVAAVPFEHLEEYTPPPAQDGGFDLAWPVDDEGSADFAETVGQTLADQGYCLVQMFMGPEDHQEALDIAGRAGQEHEFKEELEVDYMGRDSYTKTKKLKPDDLDLAPADTLAQCERQLSQIGMMVGPQTGHLFGFETIGRSASFVRMRYSSKSEAEKSRPAPLEEEDIQDGAVSNHIRFVNSRKICMLYVISSEGGELRLYPKDGREATLPLANSQVLIFRHDKMTFSYRPKGQSLALQSWILRDVPDFEVSEITGGGLEIDKVYEVWGPDRQVGLKFQIMEMQTRFPGTSLEPHMYWSMTSQCTDCCTEWPFLRFESQLYYTTDGQNAALMGKSYTNHGGFLAYHELVDFGNAFFNISDAEAQSMSWNQRNSCEVSYDVLYKAGFDRQSVNGKHIGFYVGDVGSDWHSMTPYASMVAYNADTTATAVNSAVVATRISHVFGLIGPTMTFDTACSASLVATHHAHINMINFHEWGMQCDGAICGGTNSLAPGGFIGNCSANMLSHIGRSFTYDRTADGYQRGEGTAFLYAKMSGEYQDLENRLSTLAGSCANQDGRSASLTAPNGPSQQAVLRWSLRFAGIDPDAVTVVECHGTGTALGDPIEVGAIMAVMDGERDDPLPHTSAKSNIAHLESSAGIAGLLKCLIILLHSAATPNVHLRALNPHLESAGFPQIFECEIVHTEFNAGYCGVSSFGFGGTNSRGDLYAKALSGPSAKMKPVPEKIDLIAIACPRCMGPMCGRCGVAIPTVCGKKRHVCELIRDEFADYECCSNCHKGDFRYGSAIEDLAKWSPDYQVFITGTWNGFSTMDEMEQVDDATYVCAVALGETRVERFQLNVFESSANAIYPTTNYADETIRIEGPDDGGGDKYWVIDGRDAEVPSGTVYQITFHWGDIKEIKWEQMDEKPALPLGLDFEHTYFISGSWIKWELQEMRPSVTEAGTYEATFAIGHGGKEEFHFIRDRDSEQVIYPAERWTQMKEVLVRGPDSRGSGKHWQVRGSRKELVTVQLRVLDGHISVTTIAAGGELTVWRNVPDRSYHTYYLTGFFNNWMLTSMIPDKGRPGVFKYHLTLRDLAEQFQVVVDEDREMTLHPSGADAMVGEDLVQGPDNKGEGLNWMIMGPVGSMVEITVDPHHEDKRMTVSWKHVAGGMLDDA